MKNMHITLHSTIQTFNVHTWLSFTDVPIFYSHKSTMPKLGIWDVYSTKHPYSITHFKKGKKTSPFEEATQCSKKGY